MAGDGIGIIAGGGGLPRALAEALPEATCIAFEGAEVQIDEARLTRHRVEKLGGLFEALRNAQVTRVVMAGAMSRPALDPAQLDPVMMALAPRILQAMQGGDDALLRLVIAIFEEQGFEVIGAHELLPDLTAAAGLVAGPQPDDRARTDITRAQDILTALGPVDVGQACVVAGGLCLGVETLQGTDALLRFVTETPAHLRPKSGGVLVKRPKPGQDLRVDMPAIGPDTVRAAHSAGLAGIAIAAGQVLLIDRPTLLTALKDTGLFLIADPA
ncbi:LpxI family protein [Pseudooceanicola sp. MF1-13]|uniref:LpxI family protein n=1 Tax=Pseudooceanicola sp. MF1-13 TaxID=3379095 RepID=UPI0038918B9D